MTTAELIARARAAVNTPIIYRLGSGGMIPHAALPAGRDGACDCSGFVCWAIGRSRQTTHPLYVRQNGGWINTDAMVADALDCTGFFRKLDTPSLGAIVVFPSSPPARKVGHVGIVSAVANGMPLRVIHCSAGNYRKTGRAIQETAPDVFTIKPDRVFAWYEGLDS